jgi:hypothetical protein
MVQSLPGARCWKIGNFGDARRFFVESAASAYRTSDQKLEAAAALNLGIMQRMLCHWEMRAKNSVGHIVYLLK